MVWLVWNQSNPQQWFVEKTHMCGKLWESYSEQLKRKWVTMEKEEERVPETLQGGSCGAFHRVRLLFGLEHRWRGPNEEGSRLSNCLLLFLWLNSTLWRRIQGTYFAKKSMINWQEILAFAKNWRGKKHPDFVSKEDETAGWYIYSNFIWEGRKKRPCCLKKCPDKINLVR